MRATTHCRSRRSLLFSDTLDLTIAHELWDVLVSELRDTEKLADANAHQIKRLVVTCVFYEVATRHVAEEGPVLPAKGQKQPAYNPWFSVWKDLGAIATGAENELTITPRRRANGSNVLRKRLRQIGGGYLTDGR